MIPKIRQENIKTKNTVIRDYNKTCAKVFTLQFFFKSPLIKQSFFFQISDLSPHPLSSLTGWIHLFQLFTGQACSEPKRPSIKVKTLTADPLTSSLCSEISFILPQLQCRQTGNQLSRERTHSPPEWPHVRLLSWDETQEWVTWPLWSSWSYAFQANSILWCRGMSVPSSPTHRDVTHSRLQSLSWCRSLKLIECVTAELLQQRTTNQQKGD